MTADSRVSWSGLLTMMSTTVPRGGGGVGNNTASMTCTTPLSASRSVTVMRALFTYAPESVNEMVNSSPFRVGTIIWSIKSPAKTFPPCTWRVKMAVNVGTSAKMPASVAESIAAKASSVGAKTVNGPSSLRAPARSAEMTADSRVSWSGLLTMMSTTVLYTPAHSQASLIMSSTVLALPSSHIVPGVTHSPSWMIAKGS